MRNLKSMVAFLVVAAMLFASVTSFAYGDVAADADYATAVEVLSALEMLKGDDQGNFNPDKTITRAESAAVIVRLLGLEEAAAGAAGATQFVDVAADHWGSGYINMAAQSGIIAGYGDGNFGPEDAVTYEQFVKMLVCALGYEPKALTKGTYPTGYLIAAKEMKLTKGVSGAAGQEAPRSVVAELAYNALDINLMEQAGWGSDISYEVADGKTLLSEKLEIYKADALVKSVIDNESIKLDIAACETDEDLVGLNKTVLAAGVEAFVGYNVEAYLAYNAKNKLTLVAIAKDEDAAILTLAGEDITVSGSTVSYVDEEDEDVDLTVSAEGMYINGAWVADLTGLTATADSVYEFVLDDAEENIVTIFATKYQTAIVQKYDASRERIVLKTGTIDGSKYIKLDEDTLEDITYTLVDTNGAAIEPADLTEDAILTAKVSATAIDMVVSTATVEGKVTATSKDEDNVLMYTIGGTKYYKSAGIFNDFAIKAEGTFYLDAAGKIVNFKAAEATANYAWVYRAQAIAGTDDYSIKVLDKDGLNTYTIAYETKVDVGLSEKKYADYVYTTVLGGEYNVFASEAVIDEAALANFFEIETNANGVVTALKAATLNEDATAKYSEALTKMGSFLAEDVLVFNLPEDGELADISVGGLSSLVDDKEYTYYTIVDGVNDDDEITAVVIFGGASAATFEAPIAIVTAIDTILDDEDNEVTELTVLVEGAEATVLTDDTFAIGDVITYVVDGEGKIDAFKKIAAIEAVENSNDVITLTTAAKEAVVATTNRIFAYGTIADINNNGIVTLNYADGNQAVSNIKLADVDAYSVNFKKKTNFAVADAFDLGENEKDVYGTDKDVAHYALFVLDEDENIVSIIIVEPYEADTYYENLGL